MKAITLKEAEEFDRVALRQATKELELNGLLEWLNLIIERNYPKLSYDRWYYYYQSCPTTGFMNYYEELKEMYNANGFDFEWTSENPHFRIKLIKV